MSIYNYKDLSTSIGVRTANLRHASSSSASRLRRLPCLRKTKWMPPPLLMLVSTLPRLDKSFRTLNAVYAREAAAGAVDG